ncbi:MFS transporter [Mesorhizobium sp. M0320]|uniref:MFS transporter n=1 Tax=Mesorhizobium sp. M0320 TaxID=2956936 RepID=UPI0033385F3F
MASFTTYLSWRWNFFVNLPLGVLGILLVLRFISDQRVEERRALDWAGSALASAGMASLLWGLERVAHPGDTLHMTVGLIATGIVLGSLAIRHLRTTPYPLLDLSAFKVQTFAIATLSAGTYARMAINAMPFLLPLLFQVGFNLDPVEAGMLILAYFLGNLGMKTVTTPTLRRFGFRQVLVVNGLVASFSIFACALISPQTPHALIVLLMLIAGLSRSMQFTALATISFADVPPEQRSSASTLSNMLFQVAMLLGVAVGAATLNLSLSFRGVTFWPCLTSASLLSPSAGSGSQLHCGS